MLHDRGDVVAVLLEDTVIAGLVLGRDLELPVGLDLVGRGAVATASNAQEGLPVRPELGRVAVVERLIS